MLPPVDIQGSLDNISATATAGGFSSEYDFQVKILQTLFAAHDGHFLFVPDVFKVFTFSNSLAEGIVSVSSNGSSLPKLYHYCELNLLPNVPTVGRFLAKDMSLSDTRPSSYFTIRQNRARCNH